MCSHDGSYAAIRRSSSLFKRSSYLISISLFMLKFFLICLFNFQSCRSPSTTLGYEVNVIPRFNFPAIFLERIIKSDLPVNLRALACRSESNLEGNSSLDFQESLSMPSIHSLPLGSTKIEGVAVLKDKAGTENIKEKFVKASFGPLSPATCELSSNWGIFGKSCPLDRPCIVDEVHLRRYDGLLVLLSL